MQIVSCKGRLYVCIRNSTQYLPCILLISMDKGSALAKVAAGGENIFTTRLFPNECSGGTLQSTALGPPQQGRTFNSRSSNPDHGSKVHMVFRNKR